MSLLGDAPSTSKREATAAELLHASLMAYLLGTADEKSPLSVLSGHSDVLRLIWHVVNNAWKREQMIILRCKPRKRKSSLPLRMWTT